MKASKIAAVAALLMIASSSFARGGDDDIGGGFSRRPGGGGGGGNFHMLSCRADANDGSGLFFYGMGRDRANAYVQALETCNRQNRSCTITCSVDMNL